MISCTRQRGVQNAVNDELCSSRVKRYPCVLRPHQCGCMRRRGFFGRRSDLCLIQCHCKNMQSSSACLYACYEEFILCWYSSSWSSFMSMMLLWTILKCMYPCSHLLLYVFVSTCLFQCACARVYIYVLEYETECMYESLHAYTCMTVSLLLRMKAYTYECTCLQYFFTPIIIVSVSHALITRRTVLSCRTPCLTYSLWFRWRYLQIHPLRNQIFLSWKIITDKWLSSIYRDRTIRLKIKVFHTGTIREIVLHIPARNIAVYPRFVLFYMMIDVRFHRRVHRAQRDLPFHYSTFYCSTFFSFSLFHFFHFSLFLFSTFSPFQFSHFCTIPLFHFSTFQYFTFPCVHCLTFPQFTIPVFHFFIVSLLHSLLPLFDFSTFHFSTFPFFTFPLFLLSTFFLLFKFFNFYTIPLFHSSTFSTFRLLHFSISPLPPHHISRFTLVDFSHFHFSTFS